MEVTQKEFKDALILIGKHLEISKTVETMLEYSGFVATVKEIIYNMYILDFETEYIDDDDDEVYNACQLMREYAIKMHKDGHVDFKLEYERDTI